MGISTTKILKALYEQGVTTEVKVEKALDSGAIVKIVIKDKTGIKIKEIEDVVTNINGLGTKLAMALTKIVNPQKAASSMEQRAAAQRNRLKDKVQAKMKENNISIHNT